MFSLFPRKVHLPESGIFNGMTDCHSHLLPGVDDGVSRMEESLEILGRMESLGVRKVWLTPHVMEDIPNTTLSLLTRFRLLKTTYSGTVRLALAAEYMLDSLFEERLENDDWLPLCEKGRLYLLVETSCYSPPMNLLSTLDRIRAKGCFPLLAHAERYRYMDMSDYRTLKKEGISFQLNLSSLAGMYGKPVQEKAESLLKAGMYDLTGTDTHSLEYLNTLLRARIDSRSMDKLSVCSRACRDVP